MKGKRKLLAVAIACLMLVVQMPISVFAAGHSLSPDALPNGAVGYGYYHEFRYSGDSKIGKYIVSEGSLPPGVEMNWADAGYAMFYINGKPTQAGTYPFTIQVTNPSGDVILEKDYVAVIDEDYPLAIVQDCLSTAYAGYVYTDSVYLTYSRSAEWKMEAADGETMPDGITIDAETGEITWAEPVVGKYNFKITATRNGKSVSKVLKLIIEPQGGCKHPVTVKTPGKAATCRENGLSDYWYCDACEHYYLNEECTIGARGNLDECYTTAFHSDKNGDDKCDDCGKAMPIFKKITDEKDITSCGMYLVVSKIGDKYYTLKTPKGGYTQNLEAVEITPNADGTSFNYPEADKDVMILKTEFAAECGELDGNLPRYSFSTTIENIPFSISSDDGSGALQMYQYEKSKYGYRMKMESDGAVSVASVYDEYWNTASTGGTGGVLSAYEDTTGETPSRYFSFMTNELTPIPVELYKITYVGEKDGKSYTLSDTQSKVAVDDKYTGVGSAESKNMSTVGGISEAVKQDYVESEIAKQTDISESVSARTFADINLKNEETTTDEWEQEIISTLVYEVNPQLEIKDDTTGQSVVAPIDDKNFDGSEMTLSLCVGDMNPKQIIHYRADGTKEYFYDEESEEARNGAKSFCYDRNYNGKGDFVTFSVDSFSDIEILAVAKPEEGNKISYTDGVLRVNVENAGAYTLVLANYAENQLTNVKSLPLTLTEGENTVTDLDGFVLENKSKIFLWGDLEAIEPICEAYDVKVE